MARDYKAEYAKYQGTAEQKKRRAMRNKARRYAIKLGKLEKEMEETYIIVMETLWILIQTIYKLN